MQPAMPPNPPRVVQRAFRVVQEVEPDDVERLNRTISSGFMVLEVGAFGLIPYIQQNRGTNGDLVQYPVVRVYHHTKRGPEPLPRSPLTQGKCLVPLSHIEIGAVHTNDLEIVDEVVAAPLPPEVRTDATSFDTNTWIQTTIPAMKDDKGVEEKEMWSFRTTPMRLTNSGRVFLFAGQPNSRPSALQLQIPTDGNCLKPDSIVNIVMEIMRDENTKHRQPYVQIPSIGPFDCWTEALRLGIRVEYQDGHGGWQSRYIKNYHHEMLITSMQSSEIAALGEEVQHIEVTWHHAMKIIATLLNWRWQPDNAMSSQIWASFVTKRRTMNFDFFNQRLVIGDVPVVDKQLPKLLTLDQTSDLIEKKFGFDVTIGLLPGPILMQPDYYPRDQLPRQKCDLCYVAAIHRVATRLSDRCLERRAVRIESGLGIFQCPFSAALGRYCTFTAGVEEREDVSDLVYVAREDYPIMRIPCPPNFTQYLEMQENSNEQPVERDGAE